MSATVGAAGVEVSVILLTYNHEPYIAQAIESVLAQEAPFGVELLVSEDCSTDRTREIVCSYAARHPSRIQTFLSERNLCSNEVFTRALRAARGRYVAVLDGDDYWSSPAKLRKQVELLRARPGCALCYHDVLVVDTDGERAPRPYNQGQARDTADLEDILRANFIAACSPMFRRDAIAALPGWYDEAELADWAHYIIAARHGTIGFLDEQLGVYRVHSRGLWSGLDWGKQVESFIRFNTLLQAHLPASRRVLRDVGAWYQLWLALAREEVGDRAGARSAALAALRASPFGSLGRSRQLLLMLGRLAAPRSYERARRLLRWLPGGREPHTPPAGAAGATPR